MLIFKSIYLINIVNCDISLVHGLNGGRSDLQKGEITIIFSGWSHWDTSGVRVSNKIRRKMIGNMQWMIREVLERKEEN